MTLPLFPLHTVLFPGGVLKLRIFEERYLNLIRQCGRDHTGFVVVLIRKGREVGDTLPVLHDVGTLATIVDFDHLPEGLLGITAQGQRRFRIHAVRSRPDGLLLGSGEFLSMDPWQAIPDSFVILKDLLEVLAGTSRESFPKKNRPDNDAPGMQNGQEIISQDAASLAWRLCEHLLVPNPEKQAVLEMHDPLARLEQVGRWLESPQLDLTHN
ncbi:MAG: LON peptidase substrate-binding domain-containing protein [Magnetococcales bacterium]|nr:LON peptidase substrate-binding domain-containing protein [Magnetococcales bacterium]